MLLWCLKGDHTALKLASKNGHIEVVKHVVEHKADVNAKDNVSTALIDGLFASLIVLMFNDAAVVCEGWLHPVKRGSRGRS